MLFIFVRGVLGLVLTFQFQNSIGKLANLVFQSPFFFPYSCLLLVSSSDVPVPTACAILVCLFTVQRYGTHKIGIIFAPIVIIWLLLIGGVGLYNIFHWDDQIIYAISPKYMYRFIKNCDIKSWKLLGNIVLCIAGSSCILS